MTDPKWYLLGIALQVVLTAFVGLQAWMVKRVLSGIDKQIEDQGRRLSAVEKEHVHRDEFNRLSDNVERTVTEEDWLRAHNSTQQLLAKVDAKINELSGAQDAAVKIATAIAAALNGERKG